MDINRVAIETLADMITVYDAADELYSCSQRLIGRILDSGSPISQALRIADVIGQFSPLYDPEEDWDESIFARILNDRTRPARQRAAMLLADKDQA